MCISTQYIENGAFVNKLNGLIAILCLLTSNAVLADAGDRYWLPKIGVMDVELSNASNLESFGLLYGRGVNRRISIEGEVNISLSGGEYEIPDKQNPDQLKFKGKYQIYTLAGYGVYRMPITRTGYVKAKVGLLYEYIQRKEELQDDKETKGLGIAGGVGVGGRLFGRLTLEFEATGIDKQIIFYSLGIHVSF